MPSKLRIKFTSRTSGGKTATEVFEKKVGASAARTPMKKIGLSAWNSDKAAGSGRYPKLDAMLKAERKNAVAELDKRLDYIFKKPLHYIEEEVGTAKVQVVGKTAAAQKKALCLIYAAYFQRLVSRTPIDEDYDYTGKDGYKRRHKKDGDVIRDDWVLIVNGSRIKATDFPPSHFESFNDRGAIEDIAKRIEAVVGKGRLLHSFEVENKNWKYQLLEEGLYGSDGPVSEGPGGLPHGVVNGHSAQAKNGFKAVTDRELKSVADRSKSFVRSYLARTKFRKDGGAAAAESVGDRMRRKTVYSEPDLKAMDKVIRFYESVEDDAMLERFLFKVEDEFDDERGQSGTSSALWNKVLNRRRQKAFYARQASKRAQETGKASVDTLQKIDRIENRIQMAKREKEALKEAREEKWLRERTLMREKTLERMRLARQFASGNPLPNRSPAAVKLTPVQKPSGVKTGTETRKAVVLKKKPDAPKPSAPNVTLRKKKPSGVRLRPVVLHKKK